MSNLQIAKGVKLDPDYVGGGTLALLAKKGWGKTYAMRVMAEEYWKAKVPFVALDPMDAFWGLRSSAAGDARGGIPVTVFGGPHADAPLERTGGKLMADLVVDEGLSMVLSIAHFGSRAAERQFAMDFLDRLYRRNSDLVHLLIDEADLFAPQKPQAGDQPLLGVTENIVRRGRNKGIGITLGTQRPAVLNKDVLTQVDGLIVGRMLGPQDRNAIDAWVGEHGDQHEGKKIKDTLPDLQTGDAWIWVPELGALARSKIREAKTFDSSPTRKRGKTGAREPKGFADVDLGAIETKMAETIERAKADDPKELRREVARLKKELAERPEPQAAEPEVVEVPVLANGAVDSLSAAVDAIKDAAGSLQGVAREINTEIQRVESKSNVARQQAVQHRKTSPSPRTRRGDGGSPADRRLAPRADGGGEDFNLKKAERLALSVLIQYPQGRSTSQLAIIAGYSAKGGGFRNALGRLRSLGLISPAGVEPITATQGGIDALPEVETLPTGRALLDHWHGQLKKAEREILDVVYEAHPDELTPEEIAERTESAYEPSGGGFRNALGKLRTLELIHGRGTVRASDALFDEVPT